MPGIYSRDQFAQQLAQAIENANTRRQASLDREAARTKDNAAAIANFGKALGRTWETWGQSDEDKLAALQKEREEALRVQQEQAMRDYVPTSRYSEAMRGYVPTEAMYASRPAYSDIIKRGGLY